MGRRKISESQCASLRVGSSGPSASLGLSQSWSQNDVTMNDTSSNYYDYTEWKETFLGPDYSWWPWWRKPCSASHNTYTSYRGALWNTSSSDRFEFKRSYKTTFKWDTKFKFFIVLASFKTYSLKYPESQSFYFSAN